ncbi:DUF3306 domain-containing protein [Marinobacter algicola]|uniref:DUF3306 domain-containing protein n=1 Tax=Marinobacter algicola TaxID=236100 RepID=UPI003BAD2956
MTESRLQRWSRKKTETGKKTEPAAPVSVESEPSPEEQELAINQTLPEHDVLEKYGLPDPDAIELGTDITGFMRKEIPELLRRRALRSLWKSNPVLAVLDGLNDYDEDFTNAAAAKGAVKTLYKVGQGLIDRTAKVDEPVDSPAGDRTAKPAEASTTVVPPEPAGLRETSVSDIDEAPSDTDRHTQSVLTETGEKPTPHYRPRMRFDES